MSSSKQIKAGAMISYFAIAVNMLLTFLYTPWMKDQIGMADYGLYTLASSFITMFLLDFGIGSAVARFVAKYRSEENLDGVNNIVGLVYKLFIIIDCVVFVALLVVFFFLDSIYAGLTPDELSKFKILYVVISSFSLISFPFSTLNGVFNAYEKFVALKLCDLFQKLFGVFLIVIALINGYGVVSIVTAHAVSGILTVFAKLYIVRRKTPVRANFKIKDKTLLKEVAGFSVWTSVIGIAQRLTYNIAPSILGVVSNSYQIALYSPASAIAGYFYTFAVAINGLFLPTISRKIAQNKEDDILPLMISVGRFQVVLLGLMYTGFWVIGKEFMMTWMGEEFESSYYATLLLAFPTVLEYPQQIANTTIIAKNKVKLRSIILLASSLINVVVSPILSSQFGVYGVSISIVISSMLNLIFMNVVFYKVLKINVFKFYKECYLPAIIPIVGGIVLSTLITSLVPFTGWLGIIINGGITAVVFLTLAFVFCLRKSEKRSIKEKVLKRIAK